MHILLESYTLLSWSYPEMILDRIGVLQNNTTIGIVSGSSRYFETWTILIPTQERWKSLFVSSAQNFAKYPYRIDRHIYVISINPVLPAFILAYPFVNQYSYQFVMLIKPALPHTQTTSSQSLIVDPYRSLPDIPKCLLLLRLQQFRRKSHTIFGVKLNSYLQVSPGLRIVQPATLDAVYIRKNIEGGIEG